MKQTILSFLSTFILLTFINCTTNIETIENENPKKTENQENTENILDASQYHQELNISYGDNSKQTFDLYLPENRTSNTKTILLVHGGGWSSGDKEDMNVIIGFINQDFPNAAIVNINYRLADANNKPFPMQIDDITTVISHLKDNKTKYTISEDLGFIGVSAGAHLSMLWTYAFDENKRTTMVCSIVGPTNLTDSAYVNASNTNIELQALLNVYGIDASSTYLEEASPFHQVTDEAPPTILFYGGKDPLIPTSQGVDLRDKLQSLGVTHEFTLYPNSGHGWEGLELLDTWVKLKTFMGQYL